MTNIAVFVSGNGTNCENIIKYFQDDNDINISLVISNRQDAYALKRAAKYGVTCKVLSKSEINDEHIILPILQKFSIDFIVLAGFMLIVPEFIINKYYNKVINIHPSLLPKFGGKGMYGHHVHEAVKAAGETETGITIHFVNNICDGGEIIAQFKINLTQHDSVEDIESKIHLLEQKHFPNVIKDVVNKVMDK
ncbi:phosphoribosylglycinamide formyltransferase [Prevotella sp. CAG:1058]|nr:phosphoribosylglycinamide formyltransferase [Prevotella sp. CAG:1058]